MGTRTIRRLLVGFGLLVITTSCADSTIAADRIDACDAIPEDIVREVIGDAEARPFAVDPLHECVWTATDAELVVRLELVPDAKLFVDHSQEGIDPARIHPLDLGDDAVLFEDEAVLGRQGDRISLVTGTVETNELVPVLEASLAYLARIGDSSR